MLPKDYDPNDDKGIKRDTLIDGGLKIRHAKWLLNEINLSLDELADDPVIWRSNELSKLRELQIEVRELIDRCNENEKHVKDELQSE